LRNVKAITRTGARWKIYLEWNNEETLQSSRFMVQGKVKMKATSAPVNGNAQSFEINM
jgi:hypothetical protein